MKTFFRWLAGLGVCVIVLTSIDYSSPRAQRIESSLQATWDSLTLPYKMARLSAQEPDAQLVMPVAGVRVRDVANTWGAPRSGGRRHEGQDIFAPRGTPVHAATSGYVLSVSEGGLGGKKVFVLGAGGRRYYYAHLDDFAEGLSAGDAVTPQSVLGYVGDTGNAKGTPPHLHFGVYGAGGALDPLPLMIDSMNEVGAG